jgi:hypothetical protein
LIAPSTEVHFIQRAGRSRLYSVLPFCVRRPNASAGPSFSSRSRLRSLLAAS